MSLEIECEYFEFLLRLLLAQDGEELSVHPIFKDIKWDVVLELAQKNRVPIRVYNRLVKLGVQPDEIYQKAVNEERQRIGRTIELMGKISNICEGEGIDFLFMKNYQHYPDMGEDIDLFVMDYTDIADSVVIKRLGAKPFKRSLLNRIGGKTQYYIKGYPCELEIHHGRMGPIGEHTAFPNLLMKNRVTVNIDDVCILIPSPEDQLIIQVMQRVYGRFYLRISELVYAISAICEVRLDWDYIIATTKSSGIFEGLRYYLICLNMIYENVMKETLPLNKPELLDVRAAGKVSFKGFQYRLPLLTVGGKLYLKKFFSDIRALNWASASRLCLLPPLALLIGFTFLARRWGRTGAPKLSLAND